MGFFEDSTVEITFEGKKVRVAKSDAHLFEKKSKKETEPENKE